MEKELELTLNLLKKQKSIYFEKIKTLSMVEEKEKIIKSITNIDNEIYNIYKKLDSLRKDNKKENDEESNKVKEPNKDKNALIINKSFKLADYQIKEIFINNKYIYIKHIDETNYINTTYVYKNKTKNFIFYQCKNRKNCTGKGKIDITNKEFIITQECKEKKYHTKLDYDDFINLMKEKKYN